MLSFGYFSLSAQRKVPRPRCANRKFISYFDWPRAQRERLRRYAAGTRLRPATPLEVEIEASFLYGAPAAELDVNQAATLAG